MNPVSRQWMSIQPHWQYWIDLVFEEVGKETFHYYWWENL